MRGKGEALAPTARQTAAWCPPDHSWPDGSRSRSAARPARDRPAPPPRPLRYRRTAPWADAPPEDRPAAGRAPCVTVAFCGQSSAPFRAEAQKAGRTPKSTLSPRCPPATTAPCRTAASNPLRGQIGAGDLVPSRARPPPPSPPLPRQSAPQGSTDSPPLRPDPETGRRGCKWRSIASASVFLIAAQRSAPAAMSRARRRRAGQA